MSVFVFLLSLALLAAGLAAGYASLDLVPTVMGLVYACAGIVAIVAAIIVFALGIVAFRLGRLTRTVREQAAALASLSALAPALNEATAEFETARGVGLTAEDKEPLAAVDHTRAIEPSAETEPEFGAEEATGEGWVGATAMGPPAEYEALESSEEFEEPLNENRAGRLPTLGAIERAIEAPEAPPTLIGRYTSGGANYMIFSDGSIEAETDEGAFKFASMGDFKKFLLNRGASSG